jgi:hypothetical protein
MPATPSSEGAAVEVLAAEVERREVEPLEALVLELVPSPQLLEPPRGMLRQPDPFS